MVSHLFYYQLALYALVWLFVMLHVTESKPGPPPPPAPAKRKRKRSTEPKAFAGLTYKPPCALCEHATAATAPRPPVRPDPMPPTNRRPRTMDTSRHFCPHTECDYRVVSLQRAGKYQSAYSTDVCHPVHGKVVSL